MAQTHFGYETVDEADKARRVRGVFDSVAKNYDLMNDLMSMGMHRAWKAYTVAVANLKAGDKVLDIAAGTGDLTRAFARNLERLRPINVAFWDERLSTSAVERFLIEDLDLNRKRRAEVVDRTAAAWILQGALDRLAILRKQNARHEKRHLPPRDEKRRPGVVGIEQTRIERRYMRAQNERANGEQANSA